jgi:UDP-glucose 4-epimerase
MAILITGGAGYIAAAAIEILRERHREVVVLDDLSRGHRAAVSPDIPFYHGAIDDSQLVRRIVETHGIDASIHFAALAYVGESVEDPGRYYENNVASGIRLLNTLVACGVRRVVFSSSCATYGTPVEVPIREDHRQDPVNPYGWSKFIMERVLESFDAAYGLKFVALRYFNAAGATPEHGEDHTPETHLIPSVLAVAQGTRPYVSIYGANYPTADGTAIRDYIHISDLGQAHALALEHLEAGGCSEFINLGNGRGYSVLEVVETARRITKRPIDVRFEPRRAGDPPCLVADSEKARRVIGWQPRNTELETIIRTAWDWHQRNPDGYRGIGSAK